MPEKHPRDSHVETTHIVLPVDTNPLGTVFGGTVMAWVDIAAAVAAQRHAGCRVVTASIDSVHFLAGARCGDIVELRGQVNYTGKTSMEVGVRAESEDPVTAERRHIASAFLTFVAVDAEGRPIPVPPLVPETEDERRTFEEAKRRRERRLRERDEVMRGAGGLPSSGRSG